MSYTVAGNILTKPTRLTGTGATPIFEATKRTTIVSILAVEIAGATPALQIDVYDGASVIGIVNKKAMAAGESRSLETVIALQGGWSLRATAGTANQIDIFVNYLVADATGQGSQFVPLGQR